MKDVLTLLKGDCLERMKEIPDGSVDMVLTDPPYGTTACSWDSVIPFEPMWEQLKRITKKNGAFIFTSNQPFTSTLITSNIVDFKYCWVWVKNRPTGSLHSRNRPMGKHEDVCVFSGAPMGHASRLGDARMHYYPQGVVATGKKKVVKEKGFHGNHIGSRKNQVGIEYDVFTGFPSTVLEFDKEESHLHPTQKPVALMEYLIQTYTNPNETVLDFTMGSGTTGVAAMNLGRKFIGIELDDKYFAIAEERIKQAFDAGPWSMY
jgi:site-specific DNA-methyltransferase (adenine-specific)